MNLIPHDNISRHIHSLDIPWLEHNLNLSGKKPVAVFDIDSTIMDTAPRNYQILKAAVSKFPFLKTAFSKIQHEDIGWNILHSLDPENRLSRERREKIHFFWKERFFQNEWLKHDSPYRGIIDILNWLLQNHITLVYLTGRDEPNMKDGTMQSFRDHGLPVEGDVHFFFKPDFDMDDLGYKESVFSHISLLGQVILAVENEPKNANAMANAFPDAEIALIRTVTTPDPEIPDSRIWIFDRYG